MKKILCAVFMMFPMTAFSDENICTHSMVYTIFNERGDVMDRTTYERNWPLTCHQSVQLRYETLQRLVSDGKAQYEAMSDQ